MNQSSGLWGCALALLALALARVYLKCERDSRFHAEFFRIVWLCVRARNMRLPPTGRIESRVFIILSACVRIADCGCADVFVLLCFVGWAWLCNTRT